MGHTPHLRNIFYLPCQTSRVLPTKVESVRNYTEVSNASDCAWQRMHGRSHLSSPVRHIRGTREGRPAPICLNVECGIRFHTTRCSYRHKEYRRSHRQSATSGLQAHGFSASRKTCKINTPVSEDFPSWHCRQWEERKRRETRPWKCLQYIFP